MALSSGFRDGVTNELSGSALRQAASLDTYGTSPLTSAAGVRYTDGTDLNVAFSSGTTFTVAPGAALTGSTSPAQNAGYPLVSTASVNVTLTAGGGVNPRIDVIYGYVLDDGSGTIAITSVTGTAAPSPVQPAIPQSNAVALAVINIPAAATTNFATATITDARIWMRQAVNPNGTRPLTAKANATLTTTTTSTDVSGCSVTFTTYRPNVQVLINGTFDFSTASGTNFQMEGHALVDGTDLSVTTGVLAIWRNVPTGLAAELCTQTWPVATLASAGSHTIKLQARKTGGSVTQNVNATHTTLSVIVFE